MHAMHRGGRSVGLPTNSIAAPEAAAPQPQGPQGIVFRQHDESSDFGRRFCVLYNTNTLPHIAIIDPRTKQRSVGPSAGPSVRRPVGRRSVSMSQIAIIDRHQAEVGRSICR